MAFDAYHRWLGIPPKEQPPHHYRLLGIAPLEESPDVIEAAADQRMAHLRTYQTGQHSELSQKLLNEVAAAKVCLLNPAKKAEYDRQLGEQIEAKQRVIPRAEPLETSAVSKTSEVCPAKPVDPGLAKLFEKTSHAPGVGPLAAVQAARRAKQAQVWASIGIVAVGILAVAFILLRPGGPSSETAKPESPAPAVQPDRPKLPLPPKPGPGTTEPRPPQPKDQGTAKPPLPKDPNAPPPAAAPLTAPIDLLGLVDPAKCAVEGQWRRAGTALLSPKVRFARIQIPFEPPEEYDLLVTGRRREGTDMMYLGLIGGGRHFGVALDGWRRAGTDTGSETTVCGLQLIDGKDAFNNETRRAGKPLLATDRAFAVVCAVRKNHVTVRVDGQSVVDWSPDFSRVSMQDKWSVPNPRQFAIGAFDSVFEFTAIRLVPPGCAQPEASPPAEKPERLPLPAQAEREKALAQLNEVYDLAKERAPSEKRKLAADLVDLADKARERPAESYVLLDAAMRLAGEGGDVATMLELAGRLAADFEVEALATKAAALATFADAAKDSVRLRALVEATDRLIDEALAQDDFQLAQDLADRAYTACQHSAGRDYRKRVFDRRNEVQSLAAARQQVQTAIETLETTPDDPAANLTAGRYFAFQKGDWGKGLPMLAQGSDAALRDLAAKELKGAESPDEQLALADAWRDAAEKAQGQNRDAMRLHAGSWYQEAEAGVTSTLLKAKIQKRLEEINKLGRPIPELPARKPPPAVAPFDEKAAKRYQERWAKYLGVPVETTNSIGMKLVLIPPGEFEMGSSKEEVEQLVQEARRQNAPQWYIDRIPSESPKHRVRITKAFYLGACEATQAEYERVMGDSPSQFKGDPSRPVENVSWADAAAFCRKLGEKEGKTYRLPSEAEWEYACRAGTTTKWSPGDSEADLRGYAWIAPHSGETTHPVGRRKPNAWGLFDMHGNVWEWCNDWWTQGYYANSPANDPRGPATGSIRVGRGGSWSGPGRYCRSAFPNSFAPSYGSGHLGFRVVCELSLAGGGQPKPAPR